MSSVEEEEECEEEEATVEETRNRQWQLKKVSSRKRIKQKTETKNKKGNS